MLTDTIGWYIAQVSVKYQQSGMLVSSTPNRPKASLSVYTVYKVHITVRSNDLPYVTHILN